MSYALIGKREDTALNAVEEGAARKGNEMIVAIPVEEKTTEIGVCPSFGRAPLYMIYNSEDKSLQCLENPAASAAGGAGIKAAQFLVDSKVEAVITPRCGQNSAEVLEGAKIKIFKSVDGTAAENLNLFNKGTLAPLENFHAGFHGHGGQ